MGHPRGSGSLKRLGQGTSVLKRVKKEGRKKGKSVKIT